MSLIPLSLTTFAGYKQQALLGKALSGRTPLHEGPGGNQNAKSLYDDVLGSKPRIRSQGPVLPPANTHTHTDTPRQASPATSCSPLALQL